MNKTYLGDGLYAYDDGYQIILEAPREGGAHFVALDPFVLEAFMKYVEKVRSVKMTISEEEPQSGAW